MIQLRRVVVVLVLLLTSMAAWNLRSAGAHPSTSCQTVKYNTEGFDYDDDYNNDGVKSNMWLGYAGDSNDCHHVSSILIQQVGSGLVEFGWVVGFDSTSDGYNGAGACQNTYDSQPRVFLVWRPIYGTYSCRDFGEAFPGQFDVMWIHDTNLNNVWDADFIASPSIGTASVNFSVGEPITNGERHDPTNDTAHAEFKSLSQQYASGHDGATWYDFQDSRHYVTSPADPGYKWVKDSNVHTEVEVQ